MIGLDSEGIGIGESDPLWYKDAIIYEVDVKGFYDSDGDGIGDLVGLTQKLDYIKEFGMTAIWLLPFYPSPLKDDGYDISDFFDVLPQYGTLHDFRRLLSEAHSRGMKVITELVLNHTSDQHPWFQRARRSPPGSRWRNFYVWSDTPQKYMEARIIFKDFESSNWSWDAVARAYYWHRFYSHQPDLNYESGDVRHAIFRVVDFWLELGVDGLRLDAVPYLYEKEGTNCENLPETHALLKELRKHIDSRFPGRMLLAEANQWPSDAAAYFAEGDECHMAFHFPLMPRLFMAVQTEDRYPLVEILQQTPKIPENCQWALFLRNHDELTLEMVTDEERDLMFRVYAVDKRARINLGIRKRLAPLLGNDRRKIELLNVLLPTLPGAPVIYRGDEIGMGDNYYLGDRNGVRTPMQWSADINAGFSRCNPQKLYLPAIIDPGYHYQTVNVENQLNTPSSLLLWMERLFAIVRRHFKAFGRGGMKILYPDNHRIFAFVRSYRDENLVVAVNFSASPQHTSLDLSSLEGQQLRELFGGMLFPAVKGERYTLTFGPYGYYIFQAVAPSPRQVTDEPGPEVGRAAPRPAPLHLTLKRSVAEALQGRKRDALESEAIPAFVAGKRWFAGKSRQVESARIKAAFPLNGEGDFSKLVLVVELKYKEGMPEEYCIPLTYASGEEAERRVAEGTDSVLATVELGKERGVLCDGSGDRAFRDALLSFALNRKRESNIMAGHHRPPSAPLVLRAATRDAPTSTDKLESMVLGSEQSNTSITYGNRYLLKVFRRLDQGTNPEVELGAALTEIGFKNTPKVFADIRYQQGKDDPVTVAVLEEFIENKGDAWGLFVDEAKKYLERVSVYMRDNQPISFPSFLDSPTPPVDDRLRTLMGGQFIQNVQLLAKRTGEFHIALLRARGGGEFLPEPFDYLYLQSVTTSMVGYSERVKELARRASLQDSEAAEGLKKVLAAWDRISTRFNALRTMNINVVRSRVHGDFHLGQVVYTGTDFVIIDFEGEPARPISERRIKRSPLRDVAGMMRSLHYASQVSLSNMQVPTEVRQKLDEWARLWYNVCVSVFLKSYIETVAEERIVPKDEEKTRKLIEVFLLEKAVYELGYELNSRPGWAFIPVKGLRDILQV